jgi:asparagine synthase (glutamine-hydrolysing)
VVVSPQDFFGALPRLVWHEDEPIAHPSSIPLYFVSCLAAERVKVVLTGEGSDETLAGYGRYLTTKYNLALGRAWERLGGTHVGWLSRFLIDAMPARSRSRQKLARTFLYLRPDLETLYFDNFSVFSRAQQAALLSPETRSRIGEVDPYAAIEAGLRRSNALSLLNQLLYADTKTYLHELLMKQDQMSMAASIESRVPFLDHPLMEFAAGLPERMKLRGRTTKYVLRAAMKGLLPDEILTRPKMGFPVPVGQWFRGRFRPILDEYVLGHRASERGLFDPSYVHALVRQHERREGNHAERLWSLVNLELWQRIFLDGEPLSDTSSEMARLVGAAVRDHTAAAPFTSPPVTQSTR